MDHVETFVETTTDHKGENSNFNKLVKRETAAKSSR